jgi:hypothetical protein
MWYEPPKYIRPVTNFNKELAEIKGELDDNMARLTLAKFLRQNVGFTTELLSGIKLAPYQIITIKGMLNRNYSLCVWGRGVGKTFCAAMYCILQCIFEPKTNILIAGPTFRTARFIFNYITQTVEREDAKLLFDCFGAKIQRNDEFRWQINGGSIVAIPLNGEKIRGFRANVLVIDEFLLMSEEMIEKVLMPYLVAPQDMEKRIKIRAKEDELIARGVMQESQRQEFKNNAKMIGLSSASYKCEYLYKKFEQYASAIYDPTPSEAGVTYFVSNLAWNAIPSEMMDKSVIEVAQSDAANSANFAREYGAQFIDGSDSYFSMNKMIECTVKDGEEPTLLVKGDKAKKYLLSIDPNFSNSDTADHFAMCVIELDEDLNGGTIVHQYAKAGVDLKDHIKYLYYILTNFNIEMICIDYAGYQFIDAANESELFKRHKPSPIELKIFDFTSEKDGDEYNEELKKAKRTYNKTNQKIVFTQYFTTDFIRKGNEWLQGCIDYKKIWFAGKIKANGPAFTAASSANLDLNLLGLSKEGEAKGETLYDFITEQDYLISQVKYECASIEVKTTAKGVQTFDLPLMIKKNNSADRMRRDSYTALMLGCWLMKAYREITTQPDEQYDTFAPFFV